MSNTAEKNLEQRIQERIDAISADSTLSRKVFYAEPVYFIITEGDIWEISDDAGCTPKGGWFPDIVSGNSAAENDAIKQLLTGSKAAEKFIDQLIYDESDPDEETLAYCLEDADEETVRQTQELLGHIRAGETPFWSFEDFVKKYRQRELDEGVLYYEWEDDYIELWDNIFDTGEPTETFEEMSGEEWLDILEHITDYIVTAD